MNEQTIRQIMPDNKNTKAVYLSSGEFLTIPIIGFALVGIAKYEGNEEILPITIEGDCIGLEFNQPDDFVGYIYDGFSLEQLKANNVEKIAKLQNK